MAKDKFDRKWIIKNSLKIIDRYDAGMLTLRALHYQLVAIGMTNSMTHYKRVISAMIQARWDGLVAFDAFSDHEREMICDTKYEETVLANEVEKAKESIEGWLNYYYKNRWENQPYYPEVFIEKKALQGVFKPICDRYYIALGACKGYPSLTFLNEAMQRFKMAERNGKIPVILYFGDYDPSGEDIPRSIKENIIQMGCESIEVRRISLLHEQVVAWNLPHAPAKESDSRTAKWGGLGQVELDAVNPEKLQQLCKDAIASVFDENLHKELKIQEEKEKEIYVTELREYVSNI
jgi:hypothetical protein